MHKITSPLASNNCPVCSTSSHPLFRCNNFREWAAKRRNDYVKEHKRCFNCLEQGHRLSDCPSKSTCRQCDRRHHTLLHDVSRSCPSAPAANTTPAPMTAPSPVATASIHSVQAMEGAHQAEVHATAAVTVWNGDLAEPTRAFLDGGAAVSLIEEGLVHQLRLKKRREKVVFSCVVSELHSDYIIDLAVGSLQTNRNLYHPKYVVTVKCHVVRDLRCTTRILNYQNADLVHLMSGKQWADPEETSSLPIYFLLSTRAPADARLPHSDVRKTAAGGLEADHYSFGWVVSGSLSSPLPVSAVRKPVRLLTSQEEQHLDADLTGLWELDQICLQSAKPHHVESIFASTVQRLTSGRYEVAQLWKDPRPELGISRQVALKQFLQNERSLTAKGRWNAYQKNLDEYLKMDHAEVIPFCELNPSPRDSFYLPTHVVVKEDSSTTKLVNILTHFRTYNVALTSDVGKMFREVSLRPEDRDFQRFLRRDPDTNKLQECRMTRLTFGIKTSLFLVSRVLLQLAKDLKERYPEASEIVKTSFYVDDCITGADTPEEVLCLQQSLVQLF